MGIDVKRGIPVVNDVLDKREGLGIRLNICFVRKGGCSVSPPPKGESGIGRIGVAPVKDVKTRTDINYSVAYHCSQWFIMTESVFPGVLVDM
jgi:hypothetical protein